MREVYLKTLGMLFMIAVGYLMKRTGWLSKQDARVLSKIVINITLPSVILKNLNGIIISRELLAAIVMGFAANAFLLAVVFFVTHNAGTEKRYIYCFSIPLFNISSYAVPVAQSFATTEEIAALLLFNLPTTVFACVVVPTFAKVFCKKSGGLDLHIAAGNLLRNVPAMVSIGMTVLGLLHISLPRQATGLVSSFSSANTALAMLSIGLLFEPPTKKSAESFRVIALRLGCVTALAWFTRSGIVPLGNLSNILTLVLFAPMVSFAPAMAYEQGYTGSGVALANSAYLPISVACMVLIANLLF